MYVCLKLCGVLIMAISFQKSYTDALQAFSSTFHHIITVLYSLKHLSDFGAKLS